MPSLALAITGLPPEFARLRPGASYWFACTGSEHADAVAAGLLSTASHVDHAVVVGLGRAPQSMLEGLADDVGPRNTRLFQIPVVDVGRALLDLPVDLQRVTAERDALCIVQLPADVLEGLDDRRLARLSERLQAWAQAGNHYLLVLAQGEAPTLAPRLLAGNRWCDGVAQLHPHRGALQLLMHYWSNADGVISHREFRVERRGVAWAVVADEADQTLQAALEHEGGDRFVVLAQTEVLEGAPPFSPAWRLYDSWSSLVLPALQAQAATVVLAVRDNAEVDALARLVHRLRRERGNGVKLVVREMAPCLRYSDERLLLQCGVTLVVPANTPLARFLTLLETIQGQRWQGQLPADPEPLIRGHRPPDVGGIVSPERFRQVVMDLLGDDGSAVESAVLTLQPVAGLRAQQTLQQLSIRRRGDIACVYRGQVRLFLFACRRDGVERALGNLFRLSWKELFDGYQRLAEHDVEAMNPTGREPESEVLPPAPALQLPTTAGTPRARPQPLRLGGAA